MGFEPPNFLPDEPAYEASMPGALFLYSDLGVSADFSS